MKNITYLIIFTAVCLITVSHLASEPGVSSSEWELKVLVEKANVYMEPDTRSPVVTTVTKGTVLESYERQNLWFRVIIKSDKDGFMSLGYIHFNDVEIIREKLIEETDFWTYEDPETFSGIGLSMILSGGLTYFYGGDFGVGTRGLYDNNSAYLAAQGYTIEHFSNSFHYGAEASVDVVYNLSPKFGIGIGFGYINAASQNILTYGKGETLYKPFQMKSQPEIRVVPLKAGMFFSFPLSKMFTLTFNAGPSLYFAKYRFTLGSDADEISSLYHSASSSQIGFQGGIIIELNLNQRAIFLIEGHGRYAKIDGFQGKARINEWELMPNNMVNDNITTWEGSLYYLKGQAHPSLVMSEGKPSGYENIRSAVLDLSGFNLRAGLRFRF